MKEFVVLEASSNEDLVRQVKEAATDGYAPIGGPYITTWADGQGLVHQLHRSYEDHPIWVTINLLMSREVEDQPKDQPLGDRQ